MKNNQEEDNGGVEIMSHISSPLLPKGKLRSRNVSKYL